MASWISFPKTQRRGLGWQFKSVSHLHLVAMKAVDVGQNFLVGEFRVTGREKGWMLSPRHLWIIVGWREANLQTLGSPSLGGKESTGSILCYKS